MLLNAERDTENGKIKLTLAIHYYYYNIARIRLCLHQIIVSQLTLRWRDYDQIQ